MDEERKELLHARARTLRADMTPQERKLWYLFLKRYPIHFRRQVVIGDYIVDFYSIPARLAIELDGGQHYQPEYRVYDARRTKRIEKHGIMVIRFTNREIDTDLENVKFFIHETVKKRIKELNS